MLTPSIFEENFMDDLFGFPYMKDFDNMERKLYGRRANRMMKTDIRETDNNYEKGNARCEIEITEYKEKRK